MVKVKADQIRKVREKTGAPVIRVKKVLEEFAGNEKKAVEVLRKEGHEKATKRAGRETTQGIVASYVHHNKKVASIVELLCETDFVARNEVFIKLGQDLAMQVASSNPKNLKELESQEYIRDSSQKISDLVKDTIAKIGENVRIGRFYHIELGQ